MRMSWRTRKKGSLRQVGKKFPVKGNAQVHQERPVKVYKRGSLFKGTYYGDKPSDDYRSGVIISPKFIRKITPDDIEDIVTDRTGISILGPEKNTTRYVSRNYDWSGKKIDNRLRYFTSVGGDSPIYDEVNAGKHKGFITASKVLEMMKMGKNVRLSRCF